MSGIEFNPFYQIVFAPHQEGDEKSVRVTQRVSQPEFATDFQDFTTFLAGQRRAMSAEIAKAAKSPASADPVSILALQDANEAYRRVYAILIEGARKTPEGSVTSEAMTELRTHYAGLADETVQLRQIAAEGMSLAAPLTLHTKPLSFR